MWRSTPARRGLRQTPTLLSFVSACLFPSCWTHNRPSFTITQNKIQFFLEGENSWDCTDPQESVLALLCGSTFFFFSSVLQHFSDQKLLLLFSLKKLKPHLFSLSHPFSGRHLPLWPLAWSPSIGFAAPALTPVQKLNFWSRFSPHSH